MNQVEAEIGWRNDWNSEIKDFDDTKLGVKGLVDAGVMKIPRIFIHPQHNPQDKLACEDSQFSIPIIDLQGVNSDVILRAKAIEKIQNACEKWGFFRMVNHGINKSDLEEMLAGIRRFHEQDAEVKELYSPPTVTWRDTLGLNMDSIPPEPETLPAVCRDIVVEHSKQVKHLGYTLLELLSEALGLEPNHFKNMEFAKQGFFLAQYYPSCPEPELTLGTKRHTDSNFLTIVLQDQVGGLQILHENHWMDVPPIPGALVINTGDVLQIVTNGRFKSVEHRVLAQHEGPRISVASFFNSCFPPSSKVYTPIKELLSEDNPPNDK
ncbi:hypothetical protein AAG906_035445 [Vitis piasezkii]